MKCPLCNHLEDKVIDSRPVEEGAAIRRRRECMHCRNRFTTYEKLENPPIFVVKKDGTRELFSRDKLLSGLTKACHKRPVAMEDLDLLVSRVEQRCSGELNREVESREIGEMLMKLLRDLDKVAYVRFASVYREFADVDSFMDEMKKLVELEYLGRGKDGAEPKAEIRPET